MASCPTSIARANAKGLPPSSERVGILSPRPVEFGHFIGNRRFDQLLPKIGDNCHRHAQLRRLRAGLIDHLTLARLVPHGAAIRLPPLTRPV